MHPDECRQHDPDSPWQTCSCIGIAGFSSLLGRHMASCTDMQRVTKPLCKHPESQAAFPEAHHSIFAGKLLVWHWGQQQSAGFSYLCIAAS